jgi:hypothetical protein
MSKPKKVIVIQERKLGRENAHGQAVDFDTDNPLIEISPNLKGRDRLTILIHEAMHVSFPTMSERQVIRAGKLIAAVLWADNYRRVDQ